MKRYVLDANAAIINFEGRNGSEKVRKILEAADEHEAEIFMSAINVAEVFSAIWKRHGQSEARRAIHMLISAPLTVIDVPLSTALEAAEIRAKYHFGMGDCFAALTTMEKKATLVTADAGFHRVEDKIKILWLPGHKSVN